jgi:predicted extracellular nuclease
MKSSACAALGAIAIVASASASIRITEVMSSSGDGGTPDWFEVTNYGSSAVDITGWRMDDSSFSFGASVALQGITSIAAGQSVIFVEGNAAGVAGFTSFWGGLSGVSVGYYSGSGISFGSGGDGVVLYNASGTETTARATFGAATTGSSFYFDLAPNNVGIVSTVGTIGTQLTFATTGSVVNIGSLGTAIAIPAPGAVALLAAAGMASRRRRAN